MQLFVLNLAICYRACEVEGSSCASLTCRLSGQRFLQFLRKVISFQTLRFYFSPRLKIVSVIILRAVQCRYKRYYNRYINKLDGSTHPCVTEQCSGGVGRNIAEVLWKLRGGNVRLLTAIGDDAEGRFLMDDVPGMILDGCVIKGGRTPTYAAVLDKAGECRLGLGDMALYNHITKDLVNKNIEVIKQATMVVLDGNVPQTTMEYVMQVCNHLQKPVFFEPTDTRKAVKPLQTNSLLTYASPNLAELRAMAYHMKPELNLDTPNDLSEIVELAKLVPLVKNFIVTLGSKGVLVVNNNLEEAKYYPAEYVSSVVNVSGAGDCFAGGLIHGLLSGLEEPLCIAMGFQAARAALGSRKTVPSTLTINYSLVQARSSKLKY